MYSYNAKSMFSSFSCITAESISGYASSLYRPKGGSSGRAQFCMRLLGNMLLGHTWKNLLIAEHEGKSKLWFHRNLVSEETIVCNSRWQGMTFCAWSQWIFCHLLRRLQDQAGESIPCPDPLISKSHMMTDEEFLWWRDSTALLMCVPTAPFLLSLFALPLVSCGTISLWWVSTLFPKAGLVLCMLWACPEVHGSSEIL